MNEVTIYRSVGRLMGTHKDGEALGTGGREVITTLRGEEGAVELRPSEQRSPRGGDVA